MKRARLYFFSLLIFLEAHCFAATPEIYDCFLFNNELELLEIRLHELYEHVDHFVLVESRETFRGNLKPLYYNENKHLFDKYSDKIIHVVVDEVLAVEDPWVIDRFQRNQIMRGLEKCNDNDIIFVSDLDEIYRPCIIPEVCKLLETKEEKMVLLNLDLYWFFFNRLDTTRLCPCGYALFYHNLATSTPQDCRDSRLQTSFQLNHAGWHFTYMGGLEKVKEKLATSTCHFEFDIPVNKDPIQFEKNVRSLKYVEIDKTFPRLIFEDQERWIELGFIDTCSIEYPRHWDLLPMEFY